MVDRKYWVVSQSEQEIGSSDLEGNLTAAGFRLEYDAHSLVPNEGSVDPDKVRIMALAARVMGFRMRRSGEVAVIEASVLDPGWSQIAYDHEPGLRKRDFVDTAQVNGISALTGVRLWTGLARVYARTFNTVQAAGPHAERWPGTIPDSAWLLRYNVLREGKNGGLAVDGVDDLDPYALGQFYSAINPIGRNALRNLQELKKYETYRTFGPKGLALIGAVLRQAGVIT